MLGGMTLLKRAQNSWAVSKARMCLRLSAQVSVAALSLALSYHSAHLLIDDSSSRGIKNGPGDKKGRNRVCSLHEQHYHQSGTGSTRRRRLYSSRGPEYSGNISLAQQPSLLNYTFRNLSPKVRVI